MADMTEEEDEDVELEHSPLYQYMQENGLLQEKVVDTSTPKNKPIISLWNKIWAFFKKIGPALTLCGNHGFLRNPVYDNLFKSYLTEHRSAVLNCRALVEEDANFLENVFAQGSTLLSPDSSHFSSVVFWKRLFLPACLLLSYGIAKCQRNFSLVYSPFNAKVEVVFVTVLSGFFVLNLSTILVAWKKKADCQKSLQSLQTFIRECGEFLQCVKHCLCYIQELEVIGRGLLLTRPGTTITRLEQSLLFPRSPFPNGCLCTPLRFSLFRSVRQQLSAAKLATLQLIDSYPLRKEFDHKSHYIAYVDYDEFGPLLKADVSNDEQVLLATSNLSVSAIKSVCQLYNVQLSELLRRLALCFNPELYGDSSDKCADAPFKVVPVIIKPLCIGLKTSSKILRESYLFHQLTTQSNNASKLKSSLKTAPVTSHCALVTAIRSLSLHLQVSLARIQDFADEVESVGVAAALDDDAEGCISENAYRTLNSQLELVNQDIQACQACWDESSLRLRKLCNKEVSVKDLLDPAPVDPGSYPSTTQPEIPFLDKTDIAPADQIFEAYIDATENPPEDCDVVWDVEFRKKTLEESDISKRMFSELKVVLVSKAEEWQEREAKVLAVSSVVQPSALNTDEIKDSPMELPPACGHETVNMPETPLMSGVVTENGKSGEQCSLDDGQQQQEVFELAALSTVGARSIATMAAARSRMLKLNTCLKGETFKCVGEEYSDSDASDNEDAEN